MEGVTARIAAHAGPRPSISLAIVLENAGADDWSGKVLEPVIPWDLRAWVDGQEVAVRQPPLDVGVRPRRIALAPGEHIELSSPIVLVFDEPQDNAFVWALGTPPVPAVELEASLKVGAEQVRAPRTVVQLPE